jgi:uncharacterized RDD family membrane protein YckC
LDPPNSNYVSFARRFFGDQLLEVVIFILTLGVGWYVWLALVSPRGRTPAKDFVGVTIHDHRTGRVSRWQQVWLREVFGKGLFPAFLAAVGSFAFGPAQGSTLFALYFVLGGLSPLVLEERRAIWDHVAGTYVAYEPDRRRRRGA